MLHGEDTFVLSTGTVCKVSWTRPEVGVDITKEEQERRMKHFARTWLNILTEECEEMIRNGEPEKAEERWRGTGINIPPPWLDK